MTELQKAWKTYYLTCYLLSKFRGMHSMYAEQELHEQIYWFVSGEMKRKDLIPYLELTFGLSNYYLNKGLKFFKEEEDFLHQIED